MLRLVFFQEEDYAWFLKMRGERIPLRLQRGALLSEAAGKENDCQVF
jgi:hypothetical protein